MALQDGAPMIEDSAIIFSHMTKYLIKDKFRVKGIIWGSVRYRPHKGKGWHQEYEASSHSEYLARKQTYRQTQKSALEKNHSMPYGFFFFLILVGSSFGV